MKSLIASVVILLTILSVTVIGSICVSESLDSLEEKINAINITQGFEAVKNAADSAEHAHKKYYLLYSLMLDDDAVEQTDAYLLDIKSSAEAESIEGVLTAKSRLIAHIEQIRRLSTLNIESVF